MLYEVITQGGDVWSPVSIPPTVQAGGTLRGHGTIGGSISAMSGTVMPGGSTGILTVV